MVGFENYLAEMIVTTRRCVAFKNHNARPKVRSQLALKIFAFKNRVRPITLSCMVGCKNYLAQIIITTGRYVACKKHVARSKVKVTPPV